MRPLIAVLLTTFAVAESAAAQATSGASSGAVPTRFTVRIANVSDSSTLKLSTGGSTAMLVSPAVWVIHSGASPLFVPGEVEPGLGLEGLAEAGMAAPFAAKLRGVAGVTGAGVAKGPVASGPDRGAKASSPLLEPNFHYEFTLEARRGDRLSFAMMIGDSNDGLLATDPAGIALFDASGKPVSGNVTAQVQSWDAGTEVNEEPGIGPNQGLRQGAPHAGDPERRPVRPMSAVEYGTLWPAAGKIVRVTITPARG